LAEDAQVGLSILLPETFIDFSGGDWGSEDTNATGLAIDPIALEGAAIWPDELSVATFAVLVVDH